MASETVLKVMMTSIVFKLKLIQQPRNNVVFLEMNRNLDNFIYDEKVPESNKKKIC